MAIDPGVHAPLLDVFRKGDVARDIRLQAARGALAPRALEQVALLALLTEDGDPEIAHTAEATLRAIPPAALAAFVSRADVPEALRSFFVARGVTPSPNASFDGDAPLVDAGTAPEPVPDEPLTALQRIAALNVAQRMALAMKGTREERAILIRDPNKLVGVAVLSSPKLTEAEVESIAAMASISDELLRIIAGTRAWMKSYNVALALARNPKTPVALSMNLLSRLSERDLRMLSTDRNVPDILRITARKKLTIGQ